ncbi:phosphoglycerate mutase-like protein [Hyaloscypha variabilis]|uniref:Phosphoglycerate mutase-like protein n=1 Tax=Hyaloscypha variabilis (strain UAMH 11265 / GT02V1 / F) TaxID=1149755 RepID=A0A2J6SAM8_HYAVF|nr:phosphoglycerate mutase-like protein [Hyaloscypha variabilis F]
MSTSLSEGIITIIRHGEALHNITRDYAFPDPPLTEKGLSDAHKLSLSSIPDLIITSPMTRTIQTAITVFGPLILGSEPKIKVQIWPELRGAHNHICCQGSSKEEMIKFPDFDFSGCHDEWDYPTHTTESAVARGEEVRRKLRGLIEKHKHIVLITHRGFVAFLVQGPRFQTCEIETQDFRFASDEENEEGRSAVNIDTLERQDFGPNLLLQLENEKCGSQET